MGKRRHWSQGALGGIAGVTGGIAKQLYKRFRANPVGMGMGAAKALSRVRRVTRRVISRRRQLRPSRMDRTGVFTKCWDKKVPRRNRVAAKRYRRFAKRVRRVIDTDLARNCTLIDRGVQFNVGGAGVEATNFARCGWLQLGLGMIQGVTYHQAIYDPALCQGSNPAGLASALIYGSAGANNATIDGGQATTIATAYYSTQKPGNLDGVTRFRLEGRRMHVTLRNPQPYGFWLDIFYCRSKRLASKDDLLNTGTWGSKGTNFYGVASDFYGTPLECMAMGYSYTSTDGCYYHGRTKHASPQESPVFNQRWRITKKCRVYLPPGGTLEKALVQHHTRMMTTQYLSQYCLDRDTEFLLVRAAPEVQMSNATGNWPGVPMKTGETGLFLHGIVGEASWRYNFRQVQDQLANDQIVNNNYQPVTTTLLAGQAQPTHKDL